MTQSAQMFQVGVMDQLSAQDSCVHRIDPRAKLVATLAFVVSVVSFGKYQIASLLPFLSFPVFMIVLGDLPVRVVSKRLVLVAPFAVLIGILNPFLDRDPVMALGPFLVSGGMLSFLSIIIKFVLTVGTALAFLACTGIDGICFALDRLGTPRAFTMQLLFLYRYIFVLMDEGSRMVRARSLRSFKGRGMGWGVYGQMIGHLLLRSLDRAERIHRAMSCRGFDGHVRPGRAPRFRWIDLCFVCGWCGAFVLMRIYSLPDLIGQLVGRLVG